MTKKKASYAQNARKWTPARHKQYQETLARKRAEKAVKDRELGEIFNHFAKDASPQISIRSADGNAGMIAEQVPSYSSLTEQVNRLIASNDALRAKLLVYEDLIYKAMKD